MEVYEIQNELTVIFDEEATRIMAVLLDMYDKKLKVNKTFDALVKELMKKELTPYESIILLKTTSLIPENLIICPNNEYIFVNEDEFNNFTREEQTNKITNELNNNKEIIDELSNKLITHYEKDKLNEKNILEIIYNYVPENIIKNIDNEIIVYIIRNVIFKISETHNVTNINPLAIKGL